MSDHHTEDEQDGTEHSDGAGGGDEPKSDVAKEIEDDPSANPDEEHLKDLKGA